MSKITIVHGDILQKYAITVTPQILIWGDGLAYMAGM
jgi:hypothetical protein